MRFYRFVTSPLYPPLSILTDHPRTAAERYHEIHRLPKGSLICVSVASDFASDWFEVSGHDSLKRIVADAPGVPS